ncbi:non-ribosomal peptide synthetase [Saccharothrix syringae]|uniref:non-ribosomal peptide synthetase n=1 Tax=Saccharothrix syringae TaxID=103733 RepID=UPI000B046122|nr:AMP-binding protein [Saccharothrix syringae]
MSIASTSTGVAAARKEEALWLLERLVPGSGVNNLHLAFRVAGGLDRTALRRALDFLVGRHEVLRRTYLAADTGLTRLTAADPVVPLDDADCPPGEVADRLAAFVTAPFALDGGPLLRALRLRCGADDVFCLVVHHLIFDTASAGVLAAELAEVYTAFAADHPVPAALAGPVPALAEAPATAASREYWRQRLRGVRPDRLGLACAEPPAPASPVAGGQVETALSAEAVRAVAELRRALRVPEAVVLLAAYVLLLEAHGAGPDIVVGTPLNVRGPDAPGAIGYHVNVAPLRIAVDRDAGFADLVRAARDAFFGALAHADVPVDDLLDQVPRAGGSWRHTVFRHVFNYVPGTDTARVRLAGVPAEPVPVRTGFSKFDLEFFLLPGADGVRLRAAYNAGALAEADVRAVVARYDALLTALAGDPARPVGAFPVWHRGDHEVIDTANRTAGPRPVYTVPAAVAAAATATPRAVALVDGDRRVSYAVLWAAAVGVRDRLVAAGVGRGDVVALLADRGAELAAAVLGVWLAGAVYLPLDPEHPEQRLTHQLADSGAAAVLAGPGARLPAGHRGPVLPISEPAGGVGAGGTRSGGTEGGGFEGGGVGSGGFGAGGVGSGGVGAGGIGSGGTEGGGFGGGGTGSGGTGADSAETGSTKAGSAGPGAPPEVSVVGSDPAYLIYTSGSTGRPKGTVIDHGALANLIGHFSAELGAAASTALWSTTFSFDISALELFTPLVTGGLVVAAPDEARVDGRVLADLLDRHGVTLVQGTPTTWRLVLDEVGGHLAGRSVLCGGEPLPPPLAHRLLATGCELRNVYGPTETTIWSTGGRVERVGDRVPVGAPIANTEVFVIDDHGRELPVGVTGELCIAGAGVAVGYHARPDLTAERFREHPRHGRHYRTGDLARWLPDGTLELVGRADRQVKLRGHRIELGEVEAVLLAHPAVRGAAVLVLDGSGGDGTLVAAVEADEAPGLADELRAHALAELPKAAVPQDFAFLDRLPSTGNDKLDYPALARDLAGRRVVDVGVDHADPLVATVLGLFAELLGRGDVTPATNFFAHGGHSLLGAKLAQRLKGATGVRVRLADVFEHPTPRGLAEHVRSAETPGGSPPG